MHGAGSAVFFLCYTVFMNTKTLTMGNGCFWCTEAVFQRLKGVSNVQSGYSGGKEEDAQYYRVGSGRTQHAEAIQLTYDPDVIPLEVLLDVFFATHDPTTLNRQGADIGPQYRSVLFFQDEQERTQMQEYISKLETDKIFDEPIVTTLEPFTGFYPAEPEHQNYYNENSSQPYCKVRIDPKIAKLRERFNDWVEK